MREWAEFFLNCVDSEPRSVPDVWALSDFADVLERNLPLTFPTPGRNEAGELQFTYYDAVIHTGRCLDHFVTWQEEWRDLQPIAFPGVRAAPSSGLQILPRLDCGGFLSWAGFLAADGEMSTQEGEWLARVGYCTRGVEGWVENLRTHSDECHRLLSRALKYIQRGIDLAPRLHRIAAVTINTNCSYRESLREVSQWLATAEVTAQREAPPHHPSAARAGRAEAGKEQSPGGVGSATIEEQRWVDPLPPPNGAGIHEGRPVVWWNGVSHAVEKQDLRVHRMIGALGPFQDGETIPLRQFWLAGRRRGTKHRGWGKRWPEANRRAINTFLGLCKIPFTVEVDEKERLVSWAACTVGGNRQNAGPQNA